MAFRPENAQNNGIVQKKYKSFPHVFLPKKSYQHLSTFPYKFSTAFNTKNILIRKSIFVLKKQKKTALPISENETHKAIFLLFDQLYQMLIITAATIPATMKSISANAIIFTNTLFFFLLIFYISSQSVFCTFYFCVFLAS